MNKNISKVFSHNIMTIEGNPDTMDGKLHPVEETYIAHAVDKRRREFKAGRLLAKEILNELGIHNFPLKISAQRLPLWPKGICGCISHTYGYCGVAVGKSNGFLSIGFDVETLGRIKEKLWPTIFNKEEIDWLKTFDTKKQNNFATLLFSAKECFFKMQFPLTKKWLNFHDLCVKVKYNNHTFKITLKVSIKSLNKSNLKGKFYFSKAYVLTGMELRA